MSGSRFLRYVLNNLRHGLIVAAVSAAGAGFAHAQNSQVSGQIRDTTQAAVPGATVTLSRADTGDHREITSTNGGYYSFPLLLPGRYDLRVEKAGFETQTQTGIVVETGSISTVDVSLKIGAETQTVNVDATVPLLQTESSAVAAVVDNASITNMRRLITISDKTACTPPLG